MKKVVKTKVKETVKPVAARTSLKKRGYDAAGNNMGAPQRAMFGGSSGAAYSGFNRSADTELYGALRVLREESRDLVRNNAHAAAGINHLVNSIVGEGITPRPMYIGPGADAKNEKVKAAWSAWVRKADFRGRSNFYGLQARAVRQMIEAGEVLIRRRIPTMPGRTAAPLELQLLEADFLDPLRNTPDRPNTCIKQGVETALSGPYEGKVSGYWLFPGPMHPGDLYFSGQTCLPSEWVDSSNVLHMYEMQREQDRGVPWLTPVIMQMKNLYEFELAEIERKKTEACVVAIVNTEDDYQVGLNPAKDEFGEPLKLAGCTDRNGLPIEKLEPAMVLYTSGGKSVEFNQPAITPNYNEFKVSTLKSSAAGMRVPYENVSGDVTESSYSSMRISQINFRKFVRQIQNQIVQPIFLDPVWDWFCDSAFLAGLIDEPDVPVEWTPPKMEWINPSEDVDAALLAIQAGLKSWDEIISEDGRDPSVVKQEIEKWQKDNAERGIILTSDPSAVTGRGILQSTLAAKSDADDKKKKGDPAAAASRKASKMAKKPS